MGPRLGGRGRRPNPYQFGTDFFCFNGAAAWWPRKGRGSCDSGRPASCFNGAAAWWPRKASWPANISPSRPSFNGAAAWWPRKAARATPTACTGGRLQWGRGLVAAEGSYGDGRLRALANASMGPRLGGRGRFAGIGAYLAGVARFNGAAAWWPRKGGRRVPVRPRLPIASMGPRLGGRGRMPWRSGPPWTLSRFNGAAAWWPRKVVLRFNEGQAAAWLQWGRGLVAAEGASAS